MEMGKCQVIFCICEVIVGKISRSGSVHLVYVFSNGQLSFPANVTHKEIINDGEMFLNKPVDDSFLHIYGAREVTFHYFYYCGYRIITCITFYRIIITFFRITISIYQNNYSDISSYYSDISKYYCVLSNYYFDISK